MIPSHGVDVILGMFLLLAAGVIISALGALAGLGGGFLAVPFLMIVLGQDNEIAVITSLTMILANSTSSSITYLRARQVDLKVFALLVVPTIPGLFAGWWLLNNIDDTQFRLIFALLMAAVMIYVLIRNGRKKEDGEKRSEEGNQRINKITTAVSVPITFAAGAASSAFGIGGGALLMPLQVGLLKMNVKKAIATSMFLIAVMSGTRILVVSRAGFDPFIAIPFALGGLLGAQLAAYIVTKTKSRYLLYFLAAFLFIIAFFMGAEAIMDML